MSINKFVRGMIAVAHIPLLLVIYIVKPFIKIRFGYFSSDRVGHFGLDLAYAIASNKNRNNKEVNFYYLQGAVSNKQLEIIAKRELNIGSYYRYFVYAYNVIGFGEKIIVPNRHNGGSFNIDGIVNNSKYDILLLPKEETICELYLEQYGWTKREKFICLNIRDSAFFNESKETSKNTIRNSNIDDYEVVTNYLLDIGYWVVRMGKKVNKPFKIKHSRLIDYGVDPNRSDLLDIYLSKNCYFFISTATGIDSVALMFKKQTVIVNSHPIIYIYSWVNGITAPKRLFWDNGNGKELSLTEHLDNQDASQYQEKGIIAVDLTSDEIKFTVKEMIDRLNGVPLTNKQIQSEKKFWDILERHESYGKYHGVRDERASFGTSFLCNNPEFLS